MTSSELRNQRDNYIKELNKVIANFGIALEDVNDINGVFEESNDTILKTIASDNNEELITLCTDFITKVEVLKETIITKTDNKINELINKEKEAAETVQEVDG